MKKTLIAAAIGAVIAAPAIAQADVTLYGKFEGSLDYLNTASNETVAGNYYGVTNSKAANPTANQALSGVNLNSSRWGIKGAEDLGNGLRAIFQVESTITAEGAAHLGNRNTFVGLAGGWGAFIAGRHDTPMKGLGRSVDLFGDQIGDTRDLISGEILTGYASTTPTNYPDKNKVVNGTAGFDLRTPQTIAYASPKIAGFSVVAAYAMEAGISNGSAYSLLGKYDMGPLMVGLAYESHGKGLYSNATSEETGVRLAASYKMGDLKFVGLYEQLNHLGGMQDATYYAADGTAYTAKANASVYGVGAAYTMGSNVLKAQVYQSNPEGSNNNSTMWDIGAEHHFSKRVMAFVDYAEVNNQSLVSNAPWFGGKEYGSFVGQATGSTASSYTVAPGKNPSAISTGLMVSF